MFYFKNQLIYTSRKKIWTLLLHIIRQSWWFTRVYIILVYRYRHLFSQIRYLHKTQAAQSVSDEMPGMRVRAVGGWDFGILTAVVIGRWIRVYRLGFAVRGCNGVRGLNFRLLGFGLVISPRPFLRSRRVHDERDQQERSRYQKSHCAVDFCRC